MGLYNNLFNKKGTVQGETTLEGVRQLSQEGKINLYGINYEYVELISRIQQSEMEISVGEYNITFLEDMCIIWK